MKELTIEQKANAYDEALERAKKLYEQGTITESLSYVFPELKESEDGRMLKAITKGMRDMVDDYGWSDFGGFPIDDILAWLEKQSEKKPADKVEPKFHEGDTMRTWKEANDGYTDGMPVVVSIDDKFYHCTNELIPIKDQDDYEFPPINVKKIDATENLTLDGDMEAESMIIEPVWSEEDEKHIDELTDYFEHCGELHQPPENVVKWLKSLKERIGGEGGCTTMTTA